MLLPACSSRERRPKPTQILKCNKLVEKLDFRDQFFRALRGHAVADSKDFSVEADIAIALPALVRMEITGPLGIRLGLLIMNKEWVMLFVPREKTVYRFPAAEMTKDTLRRERFLKLLPMPIIPDLSINALLTRVGIPESNEPLSCDYHEEINAYRLRVPEAGRGGRIFWIDPLKFVPLRVYFFDGKLPELDEDFSRATVEVHFSRVVGEAPQSFPSRIEFGTKKGRDLRFVWQNAEAWTSVDPKVFEWQPAASMEILDY